MTDRKLGYYWVLTGDGWQPFEWTAKGWTSSHAPSYWEEDDMIGEIGPFIAYPPSGEVATISQHHLGQLRHAYSQLNAGTVKDQKAFANGLIAPVIRAIEKSQPDPTIPRNLRDNPSFPAYSGKPWPMLADLRKATSAKRCEAVSHREADYADIEQLFRDINDRTSIYGGHRSQLLSIIADKTRWGLKTTIDIFVEVAVNDLTIDQWAEKFHGR